MITFAKRTTDEKGNVYIDYKFGKIEATKVSGETTENSGEIYLYPDKNSQDRLKLWSRHLSYGDVWKLLSGIEEVATEVIKKYSFWVENDLNKLKTSYQNNKSQKKKKAGGR